MKITVLMENTAAEPRFACEHGLSLLIETERHKLLFDTGASPRFADNADTLGVDLGDVELAVLSHGHYDHGGGLARFFVKNDRAPVYLSRRAFGPYYAEGGRYIGLDPRLADSGRLIYTDGALRLDDGLELLSWGERTPRFPIHSFDLTVREGDAFVPDDFRHEQYLLVREGGRRILFSGCSHRGVLSIMDWLKPDVFVGGFHFMDVNLSSGQSDLLDEAAAFLRGFDTRYYTCHCTGLAPYAYLKERMGDRLGYLAAGQTLAL